jgi:hypothetical protein
MKPSHAMKLLTVLAMLLSLAAGPSIAAKTACASKGCEEVKSCCAQHAPCCAMGEKRSGEEQPAPVQQRVGQDLSAAVMAKTVIVWFTLRPAETGRAPRLLVAGGHAPEPLAASCIRLI